MLVTRAATTPTVSAAATVGPRLSMIAARAAVRYLSSRSASALCRGPPLSLPNTGARYFPESTEVFTLPTRRHIWTKLWDGVQQHQWRHASERQAKIREYEALMKEYEKSWNPFKAKPELPKDSGWFTPWFNTSATPPLSTAAASQLASTADSSSAPDILRPPPVDSQPKSLVSSVATFVLNQVPSSLLSDVSAPPVVIDDLETTLYLDDSASMEYNGFRNLKKGKQVLHSIAPLIAGPTRVIKFGSEPTLLHLREASVGSDELALVPHGEEDSSASGEPSEGALIPHGEPLERGPPQWVIDSMQRDKSGWMDYLLSRWDASSLGTYMWHMIEQDVLNRYRPGPGKLRLIVITDGEDTRSPHPYSGLRGMDPMQETLQSAGYDIEWHIIVLESSGEKKGGRYAALAGATGGSYVQIDVSNPYLDETDPDVRRLRAAIAGGADASARRSRQQQYELEATRGEAERVPWFQALPPPDDKGTTEQK